MTLPRGGTHSSARLWSLEEAAEFAARRDFRFVQLLSTGRRAFCTACRLGMLAVRSTVTTRSETRSLTACQAHYCLSSMVHSRLGELEQVDLWGGGSRQWSSGPVPNQRNETKPAVTVV